MTGPVSTLRSVCADCGTVYERERDGARCPTCAPPRAVTVASVQHERRRGSSTARGYDQRWRRLSERARRMQPFCSQCGSEEQLTTDHSPQAWARRDAGLSIRLSDVLVLCQRCNNAAGPARGPAAVEHRTNADDAAALDALADDVPDDLDQRIAHES